MIADLPRTFLYGITATSLEIPEANRTAKAIKEKYPDSKIILGGPGSYASDYIDYNFIDSILQGEGEKIIHEILDDVKNKKLRSVYISKPIDVNNNVLPARQLLDNQGGNIFAYNKNYEKGGSTVILSSRGCPFKCAFCSAPALTYSKKVRLREPALIRAEIQDVINKYGIKQFRFSDDMFTASKSHVLAVCDAIGDLDIVWRISCRVNPLDEEMLKAMKSAGCRELSFGIESFDDFVLRGLNKKATALENIRALNLAKEYGFKIRILFMIATPFQRPETIDININAIDSVPYDIIACTQFIPIPGCDIWKNPDKYNIEILDKNLDNYNFYMYDKKGRREIQPIIKIKDRPLDEFLKESERFRDFIEEKGKVNKG